MPSRDGTAGRYVWLLVLGLAVGWFEASVVVYLREILYPEGFRFPVAPIPDRLAAVEIAREAASIALLAAAARLAGRVFLERFAAFMVLFGVWDLAYYGGLRLVLGWPGALSDWDILFLIPVPWVGPIWAPCAVSAALGVAGSYLYWTADRPRKPRPADWVAAIVGGLVVVLSFVADWRVVPEHRVPSAFPSWLFWAGFALGLGAFLRAEARGRPG